jgi:aspartyl-tRNA(Asn)/glutamyl-tRNA(Gln) amidotransferase subunit A
MKTSITPPTSGLQSLADVSELIRQRRISPVELVTTCLERIERLQPRFNAFISVAADSALRAAKAAEGEIRQELWKGPLHGIPVGIKDFYDTAGLATTAAFEKFRNRIPKKDAAGVEKLKRAGAIVIGKMNMHTLGMGTTGLESFFGPVRTPGTRPIFRAGRQAGRPLPLRAVCVTPRSTRTLSVHAGCPPPAAVLLASRVRTA